MNEHDLSTAFEYRASVSAEENLHSKMPLCYSAGFITMDILHLSPLLALSFRIKLKIQPIEQ
jgi:hypothetical protein